MSGKDILPIGQDSTKSPQQTGSALLAKYASLDEFSAFRIPKKSAVPTSPDVKPVEDIANKATPRRHVVVISSSDSDSDDESLPRPLAERIGHTPFSSKTSTTSFARPEQPLSVGTDSLEELTSKLTQVSITSSSTTTANNERPALKSSSDLTFTKPVAHKSFLNSSQAVSSLPQSSSKGSAVDQHTKRPILASTPISSYDSFSTFSAVKPKVEEYTPPHSTYTPRTTEETSTPAQPTFRANINSLSRTCKEADVINFFKMFCIRVVQVRIDRDYTTRKSKGRGTVDLETNEDLIKAVGLNGQMLQGAEFRVSYPKTFDKTTTGVRPKSAETSTASTSTQTDEEEISSLLSALSTQLTISGEEADEYVVEDLKTKPMAHQTEAIKWMIQRERVDTSPRGGILADDMGLGKTLTTIGLILQQKAARKNQGLPRVPTLLVAPTSLIYQWADEIKRHAQPNSLYIIIYHGADRKKHVPRLAHVDLVITTYGTLESECSGLSEADITKITEQASSRSQEDGFITKPAKQSTKRAPLADLRWERIVLDEGHQIKNHKSKTAKALFVLNADTRWILTGTPVQNHISELYSFFRFIRFTPYDDIGEWKSRIERSGQAGMKRLRVILHQVLLRRTKDGKDNQGNMLVELGTKSLTDHTLTLSAPERALYDSMMNASRAAVTNLKKASEEDQRRCHMNLLVFLLRLRQLCNHMCLIDCDLLEELKAAVEDETLSSTDEEINEEVLKESHEEVAQFLQRDPQPTDRSSKIDAVMNEIQKIPEDEKIVIVSQWTGVLDIIAVHLKLAHLTFSRIDGKMQPKEKQIAMHHFNKERTGPRVMILSLRAGGVGINLTRANHIFLIDNHWNPALDDQAIDRVYRMGQQRSVFVHRFVCAKTVEERIVEIQKRKRDLAQDLLSVGNKLRSKTAYKSGLTMKELMQLLEG